MIEDTSHFPVKGKAVTGNQQFLAESGLGGHIAQNWAWHRMPLAQCTSLQEDDSKCREKKGWKQQKRKKSTGGGCRKDATLKSRKVL